MDQLTFKSFKAELELDPNRLVYIRDFGPGLVESLFPDDSEIIFTHYYDPAKTVTITKSNFRKILIDAIDLPPEVQFSMAYTDLLLESFDPAEEGPVVFTTDEDLN